MILLQFLALIVASLSFSPRLLASGSAAAAVLGQEYVCGPDNGNKACPSHLPCCSKWGFCGATAPYCDVEKYGCLYGCWPSPASRNDAADLKLFKHKLKKQNSLLKNQFKQGNAGKTKEKVSLKRLKQDAKQLIISETKAPKKIDQKKGGKARRKVGKKQKKGKGNGNGNGNDDSSSDPSTASTRSFLSGSASGNDSSSSSFIEAADIRMKKAGKPAHANRDRISKVAASLDLSSSTSSESSSESESESKSSSSSGPTDRNNSSESYIKSSSLRYLNESLFPKDKKDKLFEKHQILNGHAARIIQLPGKRRKSKAERQEISRAVKLFMKGIPAYPKSPEILQYPREHFLETKLSGKVLQHNENSGYETIERFHGPELDESAAAAPPLDLEMSSSLGNMKNLDLGIRLPFYAFDPEEAGPFNSPLNEPFMRVENPYFDLRGLYSSCLVKNAIALTYDDGPSPLTGTLLDLLKEFGFKATFFVLGKNIKTPDDRAMVKRMFDEGHVVASHSYSHANLTTLNVHEVRRELDLTSNEISAIIGKRPKYMRPPFGEFNEALKSTVFSMGYKIVLWNMDTNDWKYDDASASQVFLNFEKQLKRFAPVQDAKSFIALQHDIFQGTIEQQRKIFKTIKSLGYNVVTMNQCLGHKSAYMDDVIKQDPAKIAPARDVKKLTIKELEQIRANTIGSVRQPVTRNGKIVL